MSRRRMPNLPDDVIDENILTRLPVKSISRFRCVSKKWNLLFRNSSFIKNHLDHANLINNFNILVANDGIDQAYLHSVDNNNLLSSSPCLHQIDYPFISKEDGPLILGSCNGLVCIKPFDEDICIWNPATREYKQLPEPPAANSNGIHFSIYGFGYDCEDDDYILLRIVNVKEPKGNSRKSSEATLYSLASNSWVKLRYIPPYDFGGCNFNGLLHDGVIYWTASLIREEVIVCFDTSGETFHEAPVPEVEDNDFMSPLGIWEGKLCLLYSRGVNGYPFTRNRTVYTDPTEDHIDVWTMIDNKWSKHFKITAQITAMFYGRPIQTLQNGETLLEGGPGGEDEFGLMAYNSNLERARALNIHGFPVAGHLETYIETLVELNSGTHVGQ